MSDKSKNSKNDSTANDARNILSKTRCLYDSLDCLRSGKPLPAALCYVASESIYIPKKSNAVLTIYGTPSVNGMKVKELTCSSTRHKIYVAGKYRWINGGCWAKVIKVTAVLNKLCAYMYFKNYNCRILLV